jgi:iron complex outermembrane receptor protein
MGISYRYHPNHSLYASTGHGFSAPSLEETLLPEGEINTELKPESGWNLEAGTRGSLMEGRLKYDVTGYVIFLNNLLVTERIAEDIFTGANAGKARNSGLEISAGYSLHPEAGSASRNASLSLGYTLSGNIFTSFIDDEDDYSGNSLPGIPVQRVSALLRGTLSPFYIQLHYLFTGEQWMDDGNLTRYGGYHLLHLKASWQHHFSTVPLSMEVYAGIRNATNTHYASMLLVNAPSFGGSLPRYYYPGLPRHYYLGIRLNLAPGKASR